MKTIYTVLGCSTHNANETTHFYGSRFRKFSFLLFLLTLFTTSVEAQTEMISTANSVSTASSVEKSARNPKFKELEIKINSLLTEARTQLADASNKQWFSENLQSSLSAKSAQACPNIALIDLMLGTQSFILTPEMEKQELLYAIEFLNVSINGMLTK
jgi:hypothetical protein